MVSQHPLRYDYDAFTTKAEKDTLAKLRVRWQAETRKSVCAEIFDTNFYFSHGPYMDADALYLKARELQTKLKQPKKSSGLNPWEASDENMLKVPHSGMGDAYSKK